jgi:hypothetical protein
MLNLRANEGKICVLIDQSKDVVFGNEIFRAKIVEKFLCLIFLAYHNASLSWNWEAFYHRSETSREIFLAYA